MKNLVVCLVFGFLPGVTVAGFFSLTDLRYPEHIVNDPRVTCNEIGSFPHPADCMWFYRCVDRMQTGMYQVFFFKCEPGTVFFDPLDQCVYGSSSTCSPDQPPTPSPGPDVFPPSPPTTETTPGETESLFQTNPPVEPDTPSTTEAPVQTEPPAPTEPTETASQPDTTEPATTTTTTTPSPERVTIVCKNCFDQEICEVGRDQYEVKVCDACMYRPNTPYTTAEQECPYHPEPHLTSEGRCISGLAFCPALRQEQSNLKPSLDRTFTIQCSDYKVRPDDPLIRHKLCKPYHFCTRFGSFLRTQSLCSNFFQCYKDQRNSWAVELRQCPGRNLYSFDLDQCIPEPRDAELCTKSKGLPLPLPPGLYV